MAMKDRSKSKCRLKEEQGELGNDVSHVGLRRSPGRQPPSSNESMCAPKCYRAHFRWLIIWAYYIRLGSWLIVSVQVCSLGLGKHGCTSMGCAGC